MIGLINYYLAIHSRAISVEIPYSTWFFIITISQSSGSASESGTQTRKSAKSKSIDESDNNTGSSDERDNGSNGQSIPDGSDNGSGTQVMIYRLF